MGHLVVVEMEVQEHLMQLQEQQQHTLAVVEEVLILELLEQVELAVEPQELLTLVEQRHAPQQLTLEVVEELVEIIILEQVVLVSWS
jgi:hypothetical protein